MNAEETRASLRTYYAGVLAGASQDAVEAAAEAALAAMSRGADAAAANAAGQQAAARFRHGSVPDRAATPPTLHGVPAAGSARTGSGVGTVTDPGTARRPHGPATPASPQWANELAASLFVAPVRWGWRAAPAPVATAVAPTPSTSRPAWIEPPRPDTSRLLANRARAVTRLVLRLVFSAVLAVCVVVLQSQINAKADTLSSQTRQICVAAAVIVALLLVFGLFRAAAALRFARANLRNFEQPYLAIRAAEQQRHQHALAEWDATVQRHQEELARLAREEQELATGPLWFPVHPTTEPTRVDVFGGDVGRHGWSSLLVTLGTSVLAAGNRVTVLDLTGLDVGGGLLGVAGARGLPTRSLALGGGAGADLIGGVSSRGVAECLAYAVTGRGPGSDLRQERALATQVLDIVGQCLNGRVTLPRLAAGIRVLLRGDSPPELTAQEVGSLADHIGDIDQNEWTTRQLRFLANQLGVLAEFAPAAGPARPLWGREAVSLIVTPGGRDDRKDLLDRLLVQLAQHAMDGGYWTGGFLVVAGADHLGAETLAVLSDHARHAGVRLVLMIDQPQGDMEKNAGTGGAVCIMKMYNHRDAAAAAEFVGKGYKFVVNQITRQTGKTFTDGGGDNFAAATNQGSGGKQRLAGTPGRTRSLSESRGHTWSATRSWSAADNVSASSATGRVYEFVVDPQEILGMPETAFILVDNSGQGRRVIMADGNPGISLLDRVSHQPA